MKILQLEKLRKDYRRSNLKQTVGESPPSFDPNDPWTKDSEGRHANWVGICEWGDDQHDEFHLAHQTQAAAALLAVSVCRRRGCDRQRACNTRTGGLHPFCSRTCEYFATESVSNDLKKNNPDEDVSLMIAMEMSRLQAIEDDFRRRKTRTGNVQKTTDVNVVTTSADVSLSASSPIEANNKPESSSEGVISTAIQSNWFRFSIGIWEVAETVVFTNQF